MISRIPWNKGKKLAPLSVAHRKKVSESLMGHRSWNKGKKWKLDERARLNIAHAKVGEKNPFFGSAHSQESRNKMSIAHKGKKFSEEHKRKIGEARKGNRNNFWKGGITPLRDIIRTCVKYRQWRSDIFTRDNFSCIMCGSRSCKGNPVFIEADHYPKSFSRIIREYGINSLEESYFCEELWNINNGRTLCKDCHRKTENYGSNNVK